MTRTLAAALMLFVALGAFAHAGHAHTYMGTVTALHDDGSFTIKTTDGKDVTIAVSPKTTFTPAKPAAGRRVVVKMTADGKTAASVKMAAPR
jgi:hypothetical protein